MAVGVLLDLENLLHTARRVSGDAVRAGLSSVVASLDRLGERRFAVGVCDHWLARVLCPAAAELGVRVHPGPIGRDRADRELLRRAHDLPPSVDLVVIGSGDHAFVPLVHALHAADRRVVVASRPDALSVELRVAADDVLLVELDGVLRAAA